MQRLNMVRIINQDQSIFHNLLNDFNNIFRKVKDVISGSIASSPECSQPKYFDGKWSLEQLTELQLNSLSVEWLEYWRKSTESEPFPRLPKVPRRRKT